MKTTYTYSRVLTAAAIVSLLAGCAPMPSRLDDSFGASLNALKAYQIIDPAASSRTDAPLMDGQAAQEAVGLYQKSFSAPTPHQNVFTIGVSQ